MLDTITTQAKLTRLTKGRILKEIAVATNLRQKQVDKVLEALSRLIKKELSGPGEFILPGLLTLKRVHKPATPEKKGPNPFNKAQEIVFKAKAARNVVKARTLKKLNDMVR